MRTDIPEFNFVLRYAGDNFGCEYPVTGASYAEVVESHAIYFKFDNRTTHTFFLKSQEGFEFLKNTMVGWVDVTNLVKKELAERAMVEALSTAESDDKKLSGKEEILLTAIKDKKEIGKRDAIQASGLQDDEWMPTIKALLSKNLVSKSGVGKHTVYRPTIEAI